MFYDTFEELCQRKGVKVGRACAEMGVSRSLAAKWKATGTEKPSAEVLEKMSAYFGMSIDEILNKEKEPAASGLVNGDAELTAYLEELKTRPEMRMLFHTFAGATKDQIEAIVKAWEAMQGK